MNSSSTPNKIKKKVLVITPQQIAKLGLTAKIQSVIAPQLTANCKPGDVINCNLDTGNSSTETLSNTKIGNLCETVNRDLLLHRKCDVLREFTNNDISSKNYSFEENTSQDVGTFTPAPLHTLKIIPNPNNHQDNDAGPNESAIAVYNIESANSVPMSKSGRCLTRPNRFVSNDSPKSSCTALIGIKNASDDNAHQTHTDHGSNDNTNQTHTDHGPDQAETFASGCNLEECRTIPANVTLSSIDKKDGCESEVSGQSRKFKRKRRDSNTVTSKEPNFYDQMLTEKSSTLIANRNGSPVDSFENANNVGCDTPPLKRKPGRPRKTTKTSCPPEVNNLETFLENSFKDVDNEAKDTRPVVDDLETRRNSFKDFDNEGCDNGAQDMPPLKKKPGRPRKSTITSCPPVVDNLDTTTNSFKDVDNEATPPVMDNLETRRNSFKDVDNIDCDNRAKDRTPLKKKSGRPRKSRETSCPPVVYNLEKRRRRTVNYASLNEGIPLVKSDETRTKPKPKSINAKKITEAKVTALEGTVVNNLETTTNSFKDVDKEATPPVMDDLETRRNSFKNVDNVDCDNGAQDSPPLKKKSGRPRKTREISCPPVLYNLEKRRRRSVNYASLNEGIPVVKYDEARTEPKPKHINAKKISEANVTALEGTPVPKKRGRQKKSLGGATAEKPREETVSPSHKTTEHCEDSEANEILLQKSTAQAQDGNILDTTLEEVGTVNDDATPTQNADLTPKATLDTENDLESYTVIQNRILVENLVAEIRNKINCIAKCTASLEQAVVTGSTKKPVKIIICAVCKLKMKGTDWARHKQKLHNNITWREGETPLDLDNVTFIMSTLQKVYKKFKIFYCDTCPETKKSVIGFLGHKIQCNKTREEIEDTKIECRLCGNRVMPFSINEHVKAHRKKEEKEDAESNPAAFVVDLNVGSKRLAAKKAAQLIQRVSQECSEPDMKALRKLYTKTINPSLPNELKFSDCVKEKDLFYCLIKGCDHKTCSLEEAENHFTSCKSKLGKIYSCKVCQENCYSKPEIIEHIHASHPRFVRKSDDDYKSASSVASDSEVEEVNSNRKHNRVATFSNELWKFYPLKFLTEKVIVKEISMHLNHICYANTLKFCENNFVGNVRFFESGKSAWTLLQPNLIKEYIPEIKLSLPIGQEFVRDVKVSCLSNYANLSRFPLFKSTIENNGNSALFCGGPVTAMAWAPTPYDLQESDQILAVSVLPDPNKVYTISKSYADRSTIQFWNYGAIDNNKCSYNQPKLEFCLAHEHGGVWSMEWCPSGCYLSDQLGLLAVSSTDSFVYGYSVVQPHMLSGKMYTSRPVFKLVLHRIVDFELGGSQYHATRISWSKSKGHKHICVGYSSGVIAVFDVTTASSLLKKSENSTNVFYPVLNFQAHNHTITALSLYHLNDGKRWVASASLDRTVKFWDLTNSGEPISTKQWCQVKQFVWMSNWLCTVDVHDESSNPVLQTTTLSHIRDFACIHNSSIMYSNCTTNGVSASDWANIVVQGNQAGELIGCHMRNLLPFNNDITLKRFYLSYIRRVQDKKVEIARGKDESKISNYHNACAAKSLVFSDFKLDEYTQVVKTALPLTNHKGIYNVLGANEYPLQSINSVAINPNRHSFLYTASGYQAGFVRVFHAKFLSKTSPR